MEDFLGAGSTGIETFGDAEGKCCPFGVADADNIPTVEPVLVVAIFGVEALLDLCWRAFIAACWACITGLRPDAAALADAAAAASKWFTGVGRINYNI